MGNINVARVSSLASNYPVGRHGKGGEVGVEFSEHKDLQLFQVAAWPDTLGDVASHLAQLIGAQVAPGFGQSATGANSSSLLRIEPLKFWLLADAQVMDAPALDVPVFNASDAVVVDLSHSRTLVKLRGLNATSVLNSYLPLDLREASFPQGAVASTAFHHCGVTLWRSVDHYELFLPRGFAMSLWELLLESALQYGCEVT